MATLLFEIGTEELPSWYVRQGSEALDLLLKQRLTAAGLSHGASRAFATPRRLAVLVADVAARSEVREELRRGPAVQAAFDQDGKPSRAAKGFAKANGVEVSELISQETDKGAYLYARKQLGGQSAQALLPEVLAGVVRDLSAPRKMRWGEVDVPFLRPIAWLVALFDREVIPVEVAGARAGRITRGHRFLGSQEVVLENAETYEEALAAEHVIASIAARQQATLQAAEAAAAAEGLELQSSPGLLAEVANLIETPIAILGDFEAYYLALPEEVLSTTMIHHQRFFPTRQPSGQLAAKFVGIANNDVPDKTVVQRGYEGALNPRLFDAQFFWDQDRAVSLSQHAWGLSGVGFHKGLGTMAEKVVRTNAAALAIAELLAVDEEEFKVLKAALPDFKADLATQMVAELPELEGVMGRAYALAEGAPRAVAEALEHGVRPVAAGGPLPQSRVGAVLSVADRLDKLLGFFALGRKPSGSADPFGLRRDGVAVARILSSQGWRVPLPALVAAAATAYEGGEVEVTAAHRAEVVGFIWDRIEALLEQAGVAPTLVQAVAAANPAVITAAQHAYLLRQLMQEAEFEQLLQLFKRASNLLKNYEESAAVNPKRFVSPFEAPLYDALPAARAALQEIMAETAARLGYWDLQAEPQEELGHLTQLAEVLELKAPLDAFLDNVLVMVEDDALRRNRLALLREVRDSLGELGRLERLEGLST